MSNNSWELADNRDSFSLQANLLDKNVAVESKATVVNRGQTNQLFVQLSHVVSANTSLIYRIKGLPISEKELNGVSLVELNGVKDKEVSQLIKLSDNDKYLLIIGDKLDPYNIKSDGLLALTIKFNLLVSQPTVLNSLTRVAHTSSLLVPAAAVPDRKAKFADAIKARQAKFSELKAKRTGAKPAVAPVAAVAPVTTTDNQSKYAEAIKARQAKLAELKAKFTAPGASAVSAGAEVLKARQAKLAELKAKRANTVTKKVTDPFVLARAAPRISAQDISALAIYPTECPNVLIPTLPPVPLPNDIPGIIALLVAELQAVSAGTVLAACLAFANTSCQRPVSATAAIQLVVQLLNNPGGVNTAQIQAVVAELQTNIANDNIMLNCP